MRVASLRPAVGYPLCDAKLGCTAPSRFHDDLDIVPQRDQEAH